MTQISELISPIHALWVILDKTNKQKLQQQTENWEERRKRKREKKTKYFVSVICSYPRKETSFSCVFHSLPPIIIQTNWSIYPSIGQFAALQGILDSFSVRWKQPNNTETDSCATILWSFHQPKTHFLTFRKNLYVFFSPTNGPTFTVLILHNGSWNATIPHVRNFTKSHPLHSSPKLRLCKLSNRAGFRKTLLPRLLRYQLTLIRLSVCF